MAVLLFLMAASIGVATFIENSYDTITAKVLIYNAKWFEVILFLLLLNFLNNIKKYNLLSWKKWSILMLHMGFVIALIGSFVTRYVGFEGVMIIKEQPVVNGAISVQEELKVANIFSTEPYFQVQANDDSIKFIGDKQHYFSELNSSELSMDFSFPNKGEVSLVVVNRIKNAEEVFLKDEPGGELYLHLVLPGRENLYLKNGTVAVKGNYAYSFNNNERSDAIRFFYDEDQLKIYAPYEMYKTDMAKLSVEDRQKDMSQIPRDTILPNALSNVSSRNLISFFDQQIMVSSVEEKAKMQWQSTDNNELPDALELNVCVNKGSENESCVRKTILGKAGIQPYNNFIECGGLLFNVAYGSKKIPLPFKVGLNDFRLLKYPGSDSPSSYESDIVIYDSVNNFEQDYNVFMNHVVDYSGYRLFQSSYDWSDPQAKKAGLDPDTTILSVNHDFWGTWITYLGYLLLAIGLLGTLFNPNSRFVDVRKKVIKMRNKRKGIAALLLAMSFCSINYGQDSSTTYIPIPANQADSMGTLLVQTVEGRIQPVHTLAYDVFHKVSKKNNFSGDDGLFLNPMQVFVDMMLDKAYWLDQKIIYVKKGTGVSDSLGIEGKYASIRDFYNEDGTEKIGRVVKESFAKKDINKNIFDKELIKVNERLNILLQVMDGSILNIFPVLGDKNNRWVNWMDNYAMSPLDISNNHSAEISLSKLFWTYVTDLGNAKKPENDFKSANSLLLILKTYQNNSADQSILLNEDQINREMSYNNSNLFVNVKNYYGYLSVLLLLFTFWEALISVRKGFVFRIINSTMWLFIGLLIVVFAMHTYALGLRWYITGHAPWSNGYEALTFIAWGGVFAGFLFIRNSKITLAGTALLAFFTLMTAGHSSFDPQLTNLQPVLKSYWLMIHVACITISYGFLGLGFILGLINIFNYLLLRPNKKNLKTIISELTYTNEMTITIGLALATIGTFLGGIWANESWGRYWGWDAKETWALVIVLTYAIILHFRLIPGMKSKFIFNVASILAFSSVLMTFIGVNYYLSKGLHSYARGDTPVFPMWAWCTIFIIFGLIFLAGWNKKRVSRS